MENNKLTPKKRAEIYLKASKKIANSKYFSKHELWSCCEIAKAAFGEYISFYKTMESFPEYKIIIDNLIIAFSDDKNDFKKANSERVIALLFAYQMALDAKE